MRKACHAMELAYMFGNLEETIYTGKIADESVEWIPAKVLTG